MLDSIDRILQQYEISHYGFLPIDEPLSHLPDEYYRPWENLIANLPNIIASGQFYEEIVQLPILDTTRLRSVPEWRRAYVILTFLTHAHIWSGDAPHQVLPANIAVPLLMVSEQLGLPPTATYPALNLWNCGLVADGADITNPENVVMRHTFTGTTDEAWFYAVSVSVEAKGVRAIQTMLECVAAIDSGDQDKILDCLRSFADTIAQLGHILQRMHERCDPQVFYHRIRPFLAGSRGMEKVGLPHGIFYDEGDGRGTWRQYSGGSNAQSTLIQFLDIALGVQHHATGSVPAPQDDNPSKRQKQIYLDEMRQYMPTSHRQFLEHFGTLANVRAYAASLASPTTPSASSSSSSSPSRIPAAFDAAVDALTAFRDTHIRIVARYIITPSSSSSSNSSSSSTTPSRAEEKNTPAGAAVDIASVSSGTRTRKHDLRGTGGTHLIAFLKQTRDETRAARVPVP